MLFSTSANTNPQIIYSLFRGKQHIYLSIVRSKYVVKCISKILKIGRQIQKLCPKIILNKVFSQGSRYRSPLSPNAKKKYFWHKKTLFGENKWRKKILLPKNRHHLGCFMSFNRQLTSWITCRKSVADQLIHDDNNSPHCLQLLKRVKLFLFCFLTQSTSVDTY